jgi:hypothetical protein
VQAAAGNHPTSTLPRATRTPDAIAHAAPPAVKNVARTTDATDRGAVRREAAAGGRLAIASQPAGAQIVINGRYRGVTPLTLVNVTPGEHRVVLRRDGTELEQTVRVERGATVSVVVPLQPDGTAAGWVGITAPFELDILENGALIGTSRTPQIMLPAGSHTLQLVNEHVGFRHTQRVEIQSGKVEQVGVELPRSIIHLNALPWAEVFIDGKSVGETPLGNLPIVIGTHEIVFRHPELGEKTISTVVKAGAPTRVTADLRQQAPTSR